MTIILNVQIAVNYLNIRYPKIWKVVFTIISISDYSLPPSKIKFRVRDFQQKSLATFDYSQESYNPGDQVEGKLTVKSVDNKPIPTASYFEVKTSAGETRSNLPIDSNGFGFFTFKVPNDWKEGSISVSYIIHVGESSSTKTDIVTVVQKSSIVIDFTGESGKIIDNAWNKIYFEAFADNSRAEHVDISNAQIFEIKNSNSETVISSGVSTQFFGRGYFEICTQKDAKYLLRYKGIDHQIDIEKYNSSFDSPNLNITSNSLIRIKNPIVSSEDSIDLTITVNNPDEKRSVLLVFSQKTVMLYSKKIDINSKETRVIYYYYNCLEDYPLEVYSHDILTKSDRCSNNLHMCLEVHRQQHFLHSFYSFVWLLEEVASSHLSELVL